MKTKFDPNPRKVDASATEVEMNGRKYYRASSICAARWPYLEQYQTAFIHGTPADKFHKVLGDLWKILNEAKFGECAVMVHNLRNDVAGVTDIKRLPSAMLLTMLFWNSEDEDVGAFSEDVMKRKLEDARLSKIDATFFFLQAAACIRDFVTLLQQTPQPSNGSPKKEIRVPLTDPVTSSTA